MANLTKQTEHKAALLNRYWLFINMEIVFTSDSEGGAITVKKQAIDNSENTNPQSIILFDTETRKFL